MQQLTIALVYQISHFICMNNEAMYAPENITKNERAYTIGRGKIGTWKGTGVNGWLYSISIPKNVSRPYTCPQNSAPIYQIGSINKSDNINPSI